MNAKNIVMSLAVSLSVFSGVAQANNPLDPPDRKYQDRIDIGLSPMTVADVPLVKKLIRVMRKEPYLVSDDYKMKLHLIQIARVDVGINGEKGVVLLMQDLSFCSGTGCSYCLFEEKGKGLYKYMFCALDRDGQLYRLRTIHHGRYDFLLKFLEVDSGDGARVKITRPTTGYTKYIYDGRKYQEPMESEYDN